MRTETEARRVRLSGARTYSIGAWLTCAVLALAGVGFANRQAPHPFAFAPTMSEAVCAVPNTGQHPQVSGRKVLEVGDQAFSSEVSGLVLVLPSCDTCGKAPLYLNAVKNLKLHGKTRVYIQDSSMAKYGIEGFKGQIQSANGVVFGAGLVLVDSGRIVKLERSPVFFYDFALSIGEVD